MLLDHIIAPVQKDLLEMDLFVQVRKSLNIFYERIICNLEVEFRTSCDNRSIQHLLLCEPEYGVSSKFLIHHFEI